MRPRHGPRCRSNMSPKTRQVGGVSVSALLLQHSFITQILPRKGCYHMAPKTYH